MADQNVVRVLVRKTFGFAGQQWLRGQLYNMNATRAQEFAESGNVTIIARESEQPTPQSGDDTGTDDEQPKTKRAKGAKAK